MEKNPMIGGNKSVQTGPQPLNMTLMLGNIRRSWCSAFLKNYLDGRQKHLKHQFSLRRGMVIFIIGMLMFNGGEIAKRFL